MSEMKGRDKAVALQPRTDKPVQSSVAINAHFASNGITYGGNANHISTVSLRLGGRWRRVQHESSRLLHTTPRLTRERIDRGHSNELSTNIEKYPVSCWPIVTLRSRVFCGSGLNVHMTLLKEDTRNTHVVNQNCTFGKKGATVSTGMREMPVHMNIQGKRAPKSHTDWRTLRP